jgi:hypothetical protein
MTQSEWLTSSDPHAKLEFLRGKVSDRKLRLFAVACCRGVWDLLEERSRQAVLIAEHFAEGNAPDADRNKAWEAARIVPRAMREPDYENPFHPDQASAADMATHAVGPSTGLIRVAGVTPHLGAHRQPVLDLQRWLVRCIFRYPLLRLTLNATSATATTLAQSVYSNRSFEQLPILADALEETGCSDAELLEHLRGSGPHTRGCWALDAVLGRE